MAVVNWTYPKLIYISDIKDFIVYYKTKDNIYLSKTFRGWKMTKLEIACESLDFESDKENYATEEEMRKRHKEIVKKWSN